MTNLRRRFHAPLVVLLLAYLVLAVAYSLASPLYEPTDEIRHFRYVRHLAVYHDLPVQQADAPRAQSHHPPLYYALGALVSGWVPVAQDVYYEPLANPFWTDRYDEVSGDNKNQYLHGDDERFPFHGVALAVYLVRWMTALIGAGAVWATYRIGREVFPRGPLLAVGAAALVAFNPQFLYLSGAVNNDIPAALCGAAVLWACVRLVRDGPSLRADMTLGILYGLALLTKFHLLALFGVIELAYTLAAWRARDGSTTLTGAWRGFLRGNLIVLGLATAIAGWWFARNQVLYGDPTGMSKVNELWIGRPAAGNWWAVQQGLPYLWESLWGRFGYGQVPLHAIVYRGLLVFCSVALAGHLIPGIVRHLTINFTAKRCPEPAEGTQRAQRFIDSTLRSSRLGGSIKRWQDAPLQRGIWALLLTLPVIFTLVVLYYIMIQPAGAMGRFLFPALPAFALLLMGGLSRFFPHTKRTVRSDDFSRPAQAAEVTTKRTARSGDFSRPEVATTNVSSFWDMALGIAVTIGMAALGVYALVGVLSPAFARPRPLTTAEIASVPNPVNTDLGPSTGSGHSGVARLLGYRVTPTAVEPGGAVEVTLYWQPLARPAQNYAVFVHLLSDVGTMVAQRDTYPGLGSTPTTVWRPGAAFADTYRVYVPETAYAPDAGYIQVGFYLPDGPRLTAPDGRDAVRLGSIEIRPQPGEFPNPLDTNFGDRLALAGYTLDRRVAHPGETIHLTLYWKALAPMQANYAVFVHVLGVGEQVWSWSDGWPVEGRSPTSLWNVGDVVQDMRTLPIGETAPPDFYDIEVGVYTVEEGRLPVVAEDGHWLADRVLLSKIRVVEKTD